MVHASILRSVRSTEVYTKSKQSLKIPKGQSEAAIRRTDNTMVKIKRTKGQTMI
jgi:hypothetical protein